MRKQTSEEFKALSGAAREAGVQSRMFGIFHDAGYKGLYGGLGAEAIKARKRIPEKEQLMDRMDTTELAANQFRMTQTRDKLARQKIHNVGTLPLCFLPVLWLPVSPGRRFNGGIWKAARWCAPPACPSARCGDEDAWRQFLELYAPVVYRLYRRAACRTPARTDTGSLRPSLPGSDSWTTTRNADFRAGCTGRSQQARISPAAGSASAAMRRRWNPAGHPGGGRTLNGDRA